MRVQNFERVLKTLKLEEYWRKLWRNKPTASLPVNVAWMKNEEEGELNKFMRVFSQCKSPFFTVDYFEQLNSNRSYLNTNIFGGLVLQM